MSLPTEVIPARNARNFWSVKFSVASTKNRISSLLLRRFPKIRMLGEATMTCYPTGSARCGCAVRNGLKSVILCGDHLSWQTIPFKKTRDYILVFCQNESFFGTFSRWWLGGFRTAQRSRIDLVCFYEQYDEDMTSPWPPRHTGATHTRPDGRVPLLIDLKETQVSTPRGGSNHSDAQPEAKISKQNVKSG